MEFGVYPGSSEVFRRLFEGFLWIWKDVERFAYRLVAREILKRGAKFIPILIGAHTFAAVICHLPPPLSEGTVPRQS